MLITLTILTGLLSTILFLLLTKRRAAGSSFSPILVYGVRLLARFFGWRITRTGLDRRQTLFERTAEEEEQLLSSPTEVSNSGDDGWENVDPPGYNNSSAQDGSRQESKDWTGIIGFFHPFCAAGGGGERVLWAAIRASQQRYPKALCVVYTGDHDVDKTAMLEKVKSRFDIALHPPTVHFLYLTTRKYVLASTYPRFTLLGQSLGSMVLAYDAFTLLVPDVFIDTMGYAFAVGLCRLLFPKVPTAAYVHYPTISTDMLSSLAPGGEGVNGGAGSGIRGAVKKWYWEWFARLYGQVGAAVDVVMANSSWTAAHLNSLWTPHRAADASAIRTLFPPVAVAQLSKKIDISPAAEQERAKNILYIAQFRPEKNHTLVLKAFADLINPASSYSSSSTSPDAPPPYPGVPDARLVLVGSVRDSDDATRVYQLRLLAHELRITDKVTFILDAPFRDVLHALQTSSVGVNGMWNEHFGIGVVEYQAAGLIAVVHDSGGPRLDIVKEGTGFWAKDQEGFASGFARALRVPDSEITALRRAARESAERFGEDVFDAGWKLALDELVAKTRKG